MTVVAIGGLNKTFTVRKKAIRALKNIHLTIKEGEIFGLLDPNGAGKTPLISILAGLTTPDIRRMVFA